MITYNGTEEENQKAKEIAEGWVKQLDEEIATAEKVEAVEYVTLLKEMKKQFIPSLEKHSTVEILAITTAEFNPVNFFTEVSRNALRAVGGNYVSS